MPSLSDIISTHTEKMNVQERLYGKLPKDAIIKDIRIEHISEIISRIESLSSEWEKHNEETSWDGDGSDDIWRNEERYADLLSSLIRKFPEECLKIFQSKMPRVIFWGAIAFEKNPSKLGIPIIANCLKLENDETNKKILAAALKACERKKGLFRFF